MITLGEKIHEKFKKEFGIHFEGAESELELVGGFLQDVIMEAKEDEAIEWQKYLTSEMEKERNEEAPQTICVQFRVNHNPGTKEHLKQIALEHLKGKGIKVENDTIII